MVGYIVVQLSYRQVDLLSIPSGARRCSLRQIQSASAAQKVILLVQAPCSMVGVFPTLHNGKCVVMCDTHRYIRTSQYSGCS